MSSRSHTHGLIALAGTALLALPLLAAAAPPMGPPDGPGAPGEGFRGPGGMSHECAGHGGWGHHGFGGHGHWLAGLKLSEEQQDKVFAIHHAAEPAIRDQMKALHKAHEALRGLPMSDQYDEGKVRALVDAATKAESQLALLRLHEEHDVYGVLTPEQRATLAEHRHHWEAHARGGMAPPKD